VTAILVVAETRQGELRPITLELVAAARELKQAATATVAVAVIDANPDAFLDALAVPEVDEILTVTTPTPHFEAHGAQQALEALIQSESPDLVVLGHTIDAMGFAPAVAARLGLGFASDVTGVSWEEGPIATRAAYGGKLVAELEFGERDRTLLMLRAGAFEPAEASGAAPAARAVEVAFDEPPTEHVEYREAATGDVDITKAEFLVSIGRGIEDKDNIPQFEELAEKLGATLSVSRPLVDAGWMSNARQVGQSGKTVQPKVYLALGISGAVQHLAGMQKADTIIAVNTDPEAPIFSVAHYGAVADLFDVAEALEQQFG
jgi:electron transfer flavoprotein alpha subunit